ncbi:MAG: hypothetical protein ACOYJY_04025 [Acutalibacteraceae bacterium]|jgi:hypothetical protein
MTTKPLSTRFFLGANTPEGFWGYHHELYDGRDGWRAFLIKGGPGCGKSTLMKKVLAAMTERGLPTQALHCSSDPASLDGVVVPAIKTVIFDATAPHILEPRYWGAVEQVADLSHCLDADKMYAEQRAILEVTDACSAAHARSRRFMAAAAALLEDNRRLIEPCLDGEKVARAAARLTKDFPAAREEGREIRRFLSAVTPDGLVTFTDTLTALCPRLVVIEDATGAAAIRLMAALRRRALETGETVVTCASPFAPRERIDHLLIPALGVGFTVADGYHPMDMPYTRQIHASRFYDRRQADRHAEKTGFNRKAARRMIREAVAAARDAKRLHDEMETFSKNAVDWDGVDAVTKWVLAAFAKRAGQV